MIPYPVTLTLVHPARFERLHIVIRILIVAAFSCVGLTLGAIMGFAYLLLPVIAAVLISQKGSERYISEEAPRIARALAWFMAAYAYLFLLTDRVPTSAPEESAQLTIAAGGKPTARDALMRLVWSIPLALVLAVLALVAWIIWIVSAVMVLITESYPDGLYDFQCGVLRWQARLLAYHASLVQQYPSFTFDSGPTSGAPRDASSFA